jgi:hypothetical protein
LEEKETKLGGMKEEDKMEHAPLYFHWKNSTRKNGVVICCFLLFV